LIKNHKKYVYLLNVEFTHGEHGIGDLG